jgi:hypothetical protein
MGHFATDHWLDLPHSSRSGRFTRSGPDKSPEVRRGRLSLRPRDGARWERDRQTWRATIVLDGNLTHFGSFDSRAEAAAASEAARHDLGAVSEPEPGRTAQGAMLAVAHAVRALEATGVARVFRSSTHSR